MLSLRVTREHDQRLAANSPLTRTCLRLFLIMGSDLWNVWLKSPHALPALDADAISTMAGDDPVSSAPLIGRTPRQSDHHFCSSPNPTAIFALVVLLTHKRHFVARIALRALSISVESADLSKS